MDERLGLRELLVPVLQFLVFAGVIISVTVLGEAKVIDAQPITAILGTIVGSVGVLAGIGMANRRNGNAQRTGEGR